MSCLLPTLPEPAVADSTADRTRRVLDVISRLLTSASTGTTCIAAALPELVRAFAGRAAGWVASVEGLPVRKQRAVGEDSRSAPSRWPWEEWPDLLAPALGPAAVRQFQSPEGGSCLIAAREETA